MSRSTDSRRAFALKNHAEFKATLVSLSMNSELPTLDSHVRAVAKQWFDLARIHHLDATALDGVVNPRGVYSRAYYAAYNASKSVRYVVQGFVSMHGDDHKKVTDLPSSFPDVDTWSARLNLLYQHRLRADYDNWTDTASQHELSPAECLTFASEFLETAEQFLRTAYGVSV